MSLFNATIIVPTVGRPKPLAQLLASIRIQSVRPREVILINGGEKDLKGFENEYADLMLRCVDGRPPSLTRQRNIGLAAASPAADFVCFFDDDIVLEESALEAMAAFWDGAGRNVGGASFNIVSEGFQKATLFESIFLVNARERGRVLKSGFNSVPCSVDITKQVEWLIGGATVWRKAVVDVHRFDEWFAGYAHCEDVEYSYRVGKEYGLWVVKEARVRHFSVPKAATLDREYDLGKMHVVNRIRFVARNPELSVPLCYWACVGLFLNNIAKWLVRHDKRHLNRAHGNLAGLALAVAGKSRPVGNRVK